jgi:dimeric dUTPase (all-alpha-NTP-PPase superfamily)
MSYSIIKNELLSSNIKKNNRYLKYIDFEMIVVSTIDNFFKKEKLQSIIDVSLNITDISINFEDFISKINYQFNSIFIFISDFFIVNNSKIIIKTIFLKFIKCH